MSLKCRLPLVSFSLFDQHDRDKLPWVPEVFLAEMAAEGRWHCTSVEAARKTSGTERFKDVRAHCYCASLVRTLFIGHARATSFSSARTESKTQQNIELMAFALTWCANIFVGSSVTPTFFSADHFLF